jgi:hypothetical protein
MIFGYFTLFVALVIEAVGAYYSVTGLAAIFSGALIPILIMGGSLEVGKVTAAVWLKTNWERASWTYKLYLVPAVAFLMVLTSMGIFGFLSKAHSDQGLVSGDSQAKIAIYDEKIRTAKDNIESDRKQLKQMDEAVDQIMGRSTSEEGATKANNIRRAQQRERGALAKDIEAQQKIIIQLNEEAAPLRAENRKIEADVGPIKYIAALLYGDNPDANILERAVRWVIILIVCVFDPLALVLILAAQQSLRWAKREQEEGWDGSWSGPSSDNTGTLDEQIDNLTAREEDTSVEMTKDTQAEEDKTSEGEPGQSFWDKHPYLLKPFQHFSNLKPMVFTPEKTEHTIMEDTESAIVAEPEPAPEIYAGNPDDFREPWPEEKRIALINAMQDFFAKNKELKEEAVNEVKAEIIPEEPKILAMGIDDIERPGDYITPPEEESPEVHYHPESDYIHHDGRSFSLESFRAHFPELASIADNHPNLTRPTKASFGNEFPAAPDKGDMFLRTDFLPSRQYKYNGQKWIETDKADVLAYDDQYIKHLIDKIDNGEYEVEDLSDIEREQIAEYLKNNNQ